MANEYALLVEHEIKYTNEEPIPIDDVANALHALMRISNRFLPATLNALADVDVQRAEVLLQGFERGSLIEKVFIKLIFGNEEQFNDFLEKLHEGKGGDAWKMLSNGSRVQLAAVGIALALLVGSGVKHLIGDEPNQPPVNITIIEIGAETYAKSPAKIEQLVRKAVGVHQVQLAHDVAQFVAPAKNDPYGAIVMGRNERLSIPQEVVHAVPRPQRVEYLESTMWSALSRDQSRTLRELPEEWRIMHRDTKLEIRASNRDSRRSGWSCVINDLTYKRIKLVLADNLDPQELAGKFRIRADVVVTFRRGVRGDPVPMQVELENVYPDPDDAYQNPDD